MDEMIRTNLENLWSQDREVQRDAFFFIIDATSQPVDWAYEVWDELLAKLTHKDNHQRSIAAQVLCNLAQSDPENRMLRDFEAVLAVTKDQGFATARHCLQAIWKIGTVGQPQQQLLVDGLTRRFEECTSETSWWLLRYDIIQGLRNLYDKVDDETIRDRALALIESEDNAKYRRKYASAWKIKQRS